MLFKKEGYILVGNGRYYPKSFFKIEFKKIFKNMSKTLKKEKMNIIKYFFVFKGGVEKVSIHTNLKDFFKQNPPCCDCLVQSMCISEYNITVYKYICLHISLCDKLKKFVECSEFFEKEK